MSNGESGYPPGVPRLPEMANDNYHPNDDDATDNNTDDDEPALHPARVFANSLLTTDDQVLNDPDDEGDEAVTPTLKNDTVRSVIVGFDKLTLSEKCTANTPTFCKAVAHFDEICDALFGAGKIWASRDLLLGAIHAVAGAHGWTAGIDNRSIQCNRFGKPRFRRKSGSSSGRYTNLSHDALKVDCTWTVGGLPVLQGDFCRCGPTLIRKIHQIDAFRIQTSQQEVAVHKAHAPSPLFP